MPFYDYECKACKKEVVINLTFSEYDKFDNKCPECGQCELVRHWPLGTTFAGAKVIDNSKGGVFSKKFWKKNRWN